MAGSINFDVKSELIIHCRTLKRGDQLAVEGDLDGIEYYHHGIFLGHDKGVADFGGENKRNAKVRTVDLFEFTANGQRKLVRINYPKGQCLDPESAAKNAEDLVANPSKWGGYSLLSNNCEHFATWCKTKVAHSKQVWDKTVRAILNPIESLKIVKASSAGSFGSSAGSLGSSAGRNRSSAGRNHSSAGRNRSSEGSLCSSAGRNRYSAGSCDSSALRVRDSALGQGASALRGKEPALRQVKASSAGSLGSSAGSLGSSVVRNRSSAGSLGPLAGRTHSSAGSFGSSARRFGSSTGSVGSSAERTHSSAGKSVFGREIRIFVR